MYIQYGLVRGFRHMIERALDHVFYLRLPILVIYMLKRFLVPIIYIIFAGLGMRDVLHPGRHASFFACLAVAFLFCVGVRNLIREFRKIEEHAKYIEDWLFTSGDKIKDCLRAPERAFVLQHCRSVEDSYGEAKSDYCLPIENYSHENLSLPEEEDAALERQAGRDCKIRRDIYLMRLEGRDLLNKQIRL